MCDSIVGNYSQGFDLSDMSTVRKNTKYISILWWTYFQYFSITLLKSSCLAIWNIFKLDCSSKMISQEQC